MGLDVRGSFAPRCSVGFKVSGVFHVSDRRSSSTSQIGLWEDVHVHFLEWENFSAAAIKVLDVRSPPEHESEDTFHRTGVIEIKRPAHHPTFAERVENTKHVPPRRCRCRRSQE